MDTRSAKKYAGDISTNIVGAIIIAIAVGVGGAILTYLGSVWSKPLLVGGALGLITLLILLTIKAIRLMPDLPVATTVENIEGRARDWLDNFGMTVTKSKPAGTYFKYLVATNEKSIGVLRNTEKSDYLDFFAQVSPNEEDKKILAKLSEDERQATGVALKLELARARMGYTQFSLDGFLIFKRLPINQDLTEPVFMEMLWELEGMLNSLFLVAASTNIKRSDVAEMVDAKKDSDETSIP